MRLFAVALAAAAALAQESTQGTITGSVYDQSQAAVAGSEVTVTSAATGLVRTARTGADGVWVRSRVSRP
jgi:hypothetical protein